jgi:hypothetical protein
MTRSAICALLFLAASMSAQNKNNTAFHLTVSGLPDGGLPPLIWSGGLFAVDVASINLKEGKGRDALDNALRKHALAKVDYRLQYGRR